MCIYVCIYRYMCIYVYICVYVYVCVYIGIYRDICVYIGIYVRPQNVILTPNVILHFALTQMLYYILR